MIWIVGSKGMLGTELAKCLEIAGIDCSQTDRDVDITSISAIRGFARSRRFRWIVNCAAYTAVDKAESEPKLAQALNVEGPQNLARLADELDARIVHMSTDFVFSGEQVTQYLEDDPVGPIGVYGQTKAEGEASVLHACKRSVVLRTAWLYGKYGPNFVYTMLRLMRRQDSIRVVADQQGSPTWTADLAAAIVRILGAKDPHYGIYHFTNAGQCSWCDFATEIHSLGRENGILDHDCTIQAISTAEYPTPARRPAYSVLSKEKIIRDYGILVPVWGTSLRTFMNDIKNSYARQRKVAPDTTFEAWSNAMCRLPIV
jgi:dTDP-4-dehydrorhamnose reductase